MYFCKNVKTWPENKNVLWKYVINSLHHVLSTTRFGTWPSSLYLVHDRSCRCSWETRCKLTCIRWRYTTVFEVFSWRNDVRCHKTNTASQMSAAGCQPTGLSWIVRRQNWSGWAPDNMDCGHTPLGSGGPSHNFIHLGIDTVAASDHVRVLGVTISSFTRRWVREDTRARLCHDAPRLL